MGDDYIPQPTNFRKQFGPSPYTLVTKTVKKSVYQSKAQERKSKFREAFEEAVKEDHKEINFEFSEDDEQAKVSTQSKIIQTRSKTTVSPPKRKEHIK